MSFRGTSKLSINELVTDGDFKTYLEDVSDKLPSKFQNTSISSISDISGNVNRVKRVQLTDDTGCNTTVIIKHVPHQGKLARFPSIQFSSSRLEFEHKWFTMAHEAIRENSTCKIKLPNLYFFDQSNRVLIMEDLGQDSLSDVIESGKNLSGDFYSSLAGSIRVIHDHSKTDSAKSANKAASQNRPFIFETHIKDPRGIREIWTSNYKSKYLSLEEKITFQKNFLESYASKIEPVLKSLTKQFKIDSTSVFTQGDLHTRSIIVSSYDAAEDLASELEPGCKIGIIDSELSDYGSPDFDLGFFLAHLIAELHATGKSDLEIIEVVFNFLNSYGNNLNIENILNFCGAEVLRRLLGPAGFYQDLNSKRFEFLLNLSKKMLLNPREVLDNMRSKKKL